MVDEDVPRDTLRLFGRAMDASHDAIEAWGLESERRMVHEEIHELGATFAHQARGKATELEVLNEAADGILVCVHAAYIAGWSPADLHRAIARKLKRTEKRIQEDAEDG